MMVTMGVRTITVGIVDDHQVLLDGLTAWIRARTDDVRVAVACTTWHRLLASDAYPVDVVLLDLELGDALPAAVKIATLRMAGVATVVVGTTAAPAMVRECISAGALGFVPKSEDASVLLDAVRTAARGETYLSATVAAALLADDGRAEAAPRLSEQERRVLVLYASGLPMKSVARRLDVGYETAKSYLGRVRDKYALCGREARSKIDLRRRAVEDGLISGL
jgi:two-component system, NarL family, uhpT operon response regulator UhpA